jgi:hypothetical protein
MAGAYVYLMASLPMLRFEASPPFSFDRLLEICRGLIDDGDLTVLESFKGPGPCNATRPAALAKWFDFDRVLRNELVRIRASRRHADPAPYLRGEGATDAGVAHLAVNAHRATATSFYDAERLLDEERWRKLEEFGWGHYFDLDALVVYALQLRLLERWEAIRRADKEKLLEETMDSIKAKERS